MISAACELGIIEGFYGRAWSWPERGHVIETLAAHGYRLHVYAPKAQAYLRRRWREPFPQVQREALEQHLARCRAAGVRFGVGLSPNEIDPDNPDDLAALGRKLAELDAIGVEILAVLFDDVRGDDPGLAGRQAGLVRRVVDITKARRIMVCPSYYSDDPVLDRVFGERPADYLRDLCASLDPAIDVFWTGAEVCSREFSAAHLERIAAIIGRPPTLWDNYPVNDGPRMSQVLHLRAFTGRPASNASLLRAHLINPALQPTLTGIPALTQAWRYRDGDAAWCYGQAFARACETVLGARLGAMVRDDLIRLADTGRDRLGPLAAELHERYAGIDHPGAREILGWLAGDYEITDEIVRTQ